MTEKQYKIIIILLGVLAFLLLIAFSFSASHAQAYDYESDSIQLTILENGNWDLVLDGILYKFEWYDLSNYGRAMNVTGEDGVCYWLYEKEEELVQSDCTLENLSILFSSI